MASRALVRPRPTSRAKAVDENTVTAPTQQGAGPALRQKPSMGSLNGGKKVAQTVNVGPVKAGTKRTALGNISNKDPHVDTDIPLKATKFSATSRSRSASLSITDATHKVAKVPTKASGAVGSTRAPLGTTQSTGVLASLSNATSSNLPNTSYVARPTVRLSRQSRLPGTYGPSDQMATQLESTDDEKDEMYEQPVAVSEDMQVDEDMSKVKPSGSGLTPSINGMLVKSNEIDVSSNLGGDDGSSLADGYDEEAEEMFDEDDWLQLTAEQMVEVEETMKAVRSTFEDEVDMFDTTMVAEYSEDIFVYMSRLEELSMPNPRYMEHQSEADWEMRTTLIDWLLQVHLRYHMLPETLWIAVNIVDRFLSTRVVSLVKLQLVGVTAMFIAAKYEEILAPSVDEFVFMTENGYTKDEILKGERIILQTLDFDVSSYCSPYSWVRRISKADDYDIQTRTLSKFLMEVTLLDHRFLRAKPSLIAAIGMYVARRMLEGDWNEAFIFYSNFTETQIMPGAELLCEMLAQPEFEKQYVYKKYSNKKFLRASTFARDWAKLHVQDGRAQL